MFHTPLCRKNCKVRHHEVITTLQAVAPKFSSSAAIFGAGPLRVTRGNNKEDFKKQVLKLVSSGWSKNEDVPEESEELRLPLLHLASMFGKHEIVEWLLNEEGYNANVRTTNSDETALHLVARHLYPALSAGESRLENMSITAKVANFERIVSLLIEKEVGLFWAKGSVGRETVFHILASNLLQAISADVNEEPETEDSCLSFYSQSIDVTLKLLLAEEQTRLQRRDVKHTLGIKNSAGDTVLHLLAGASHKGYLVLKFLVKFLGNNDLLKLKNAAGLTALDIVNKLYPGHERELLVDEQAKKKTKFYTSGTQTTGRKQMELLQIIQNSNTNAAVSPGEPRNIVASSVTGLTNEAVSCVIHTPSFPGESSVQEPVSSSQGCSASVQSRTMNISESQPSATQVISDDSPPLIPVVHIPASSERPQAHIQSIQTQEQATVAGNPSWQTVPVTNPTPHIPVFFIKQEPTDLPQHVYYQNNQVVGPSQRQTAVIIHPTSAMTTLGQNPLPVQAVSRMASQHENPVVQNPVHPNPSPSSQSSRYGLQGVVPPAGGREQISAAVVQPRVAAGVQQRNSGNELGSQALLQSVRQISRRKATIEEIAVECLNNLNGTYSKNCLHTPLCDESCIIDHHHVILTLYGTNNLKVVRGRNAFTQLLEGSKYNFLHCLKKHLDEGMAKDVDMPDGLAKLRYPLVHLAAMFYRYVVIDILACLGFDVNVRSPRTGEFPLHSMLRHAFETGLKVFKTMTISQTGFIDSTFSKVLDCLSSGFDVVKILTQQDHRGDTPLHVAARMIVERPVGATASSVITELEIPDSTQECDTNNPQVHNPLPDFSMRCKLQAATKEHQRRAEFYTICMLVMCRKIHDSAKRNSNLVLDLVKPILLVKNNDGETFLQILCKEHHIAAACIAVFLSRFPLEVLNNCAKECIPNCCWSDCIPTAYPEKWKTMSDAHQTRRKSCPAVGFSENSTRNTVSPKPSSEVSVGQVSPTISTTEPMKTNTKGSVVTPIPATPLQNKTSVTDMDDILEAVITPVVANPTHSSLRPNTKRKIIDALKEDYSERLELAVKGRREVEEDVLKHRLKMHELNEVIAKKKAFMQKLEKELQELQKEVWHENQAVQALENSLEQFTKEEEEMQKHLALLQEAEPEPPAKRNKECSEQDTRL